MVYYPVNHMLGSQRNGLNHVSMNMGDFDRVLGPTRGTNYPLYSDTLLNWYKTKNVKSVRVMFTWEAVQSALGGPVPPAGAGYANYWADLTSVITRLLARDIYVILSPWQYNTASDDTDIVYDDAAFTPVNFADFWGPFAQAINGVTGNDQRVAFDLINEPHTQNAAKAGDIGISLTDWFKCAQAAINAIRLKGATNTIFVPGMSYAAANSFTTNGSDTEWLTLTDPQKNIAVTVHCYTGLGSASPTVLSAACSAVVTWARTNGKKVNIGEIAIDAGDNGIPNFCSTFSIAQAQWADWKNFCAANNDVLVGWNWWGNSAAGWWNQGDSCNANGHHWGLTLTDGATQTIYMNLIEATLPVPILYIRDNVADSGSEPNSTTGVGWESPDVWVRQTADGVPVGQPVLGGQPSVVYVKVTNKGLAASDDNEIVRLYWAKAQAGLSWPAPWNGVVPKQGGTVAPAQAVGAILPGQSKVLQFNWSTTPNPVDYGGDGHFCLLAVVATQATPEFVEFEGPNLNLNVLKLSTVAWRNIHIIPVAKMKMGDLVIANYMDRNIRAQVGFEILDDTARLIDPAGARLLITAEGAALEKLRANQNNRRFLEDLGGGTFRVLDPATGVPQIELRPGEVLPFGLEYVPEGEMKGYAVRATQFALEGAARETIGGQTFVAGEVEGFT
ncbi:MAG: cellulase family glycosylhydrolase, partial [Chloroflexia bacterium]